MDINACIMEFRADEGAFLIDVRDADEYAEGHIPGSINVPLMSLREIEDLIDDYDTPIYVYCLSGIRAGRAVPALNMIGYTKVKNIGGIKDYTGELEK